MAPHRLLPDDHVSLWSRITCPTLLLHAEESFLKSSETAGLAGYFPQARSETISGAGHWLHHDKPDEVLGSIRAFLGLTDEGRLMPMHVVICGGGVIGACTAYFLARRGIDVTVVERAEVASSASGKAGGFLARDWCAGSPLDALARRSFALHARLHEEIGGWSYQRVSAYSGLVAPEGDKRRHVAAGLDWLSDGVIIGAQLSTTETTAMVNPRAFTLGMMRAAEQHGARLHLGEVTGVVRRGETVAGVMLDGETIAADAIVIAMGPWSLRAAKWLTLPRSSDCKAPAWSTTPARTCRPRLSFSSTARTAAAVTVEVFPRADGSTHVCAFSGQGPLPMNPADVKPDPARHRQTSGALRALVAGVPSGPDHRPAILLSAGDAGRTSPDRKGARQRGRLYRNRA